MCCVFTLKIKIIHLKNIHGKKDGKLKQTQLKPIYVFCFTLKHIHSQIFLEWVKKIKCNIKQKEIKFKKIHSKFFFFVSGHFR